MDASLLPVLPHLPSVASWRESTRLFGLLRGPQLELLDEALEIYENSFRRYSGLRQAYYLQLNAHPGEAGFHREQGVQAVRQQAQDAHSRAMEDFCAVESAFSVWFHSGELAVQTPEAYQLRSQLSEGRGQLKRINP